MGRMYEVTSPEMTFAATTAGDMLEIVGHASRVTKLCSVRVTQNNRYGDANASGAKIQIVRATVAGSGTPGATIVPAPVNSNDVAYGGVVEAKNPTGVSGTITILVEDNFNIQAGFMWTPPEKFEIVIPPSGILAIRLVDGFAASTDASVQCEIEELP